MNVTYDKTKDSKEKKETIPTTKTVNCDLLSQIMEVLQDKDELTSYVEPVLELIKEKNEATSTDEKLLKLGKDYKKRLEKLKGPNKTQEPLFPVRKKYSKRLTSQKRRKQNV